MAADCTSMSVAWGGFTACLPLHQPHPQGTSVQVAEIYRLALSQNPLVFIESSFLLILAAFVYSNQHCPLSTYLPVFTSGFGALC